MSIVLKLIFTPLFVIIKKDVQVLTNTCPRYVQAAEKKELNELEEWARLQEMKRRRSCIHFVPFSWKLCILESVIIGRWPEKFFLL